MPRQKKILSYPPARFSYRQGLYGIRKWQFAALDNLDLLCEISIFSSCSWPGLSHLCRKHLTWCLEILQQRWNVVKYIDFYDALKVVKQNRKLFSKSLKFEYWRKDKILQLISKK